MIERAKKKAESHCGISCSEAKTAIRSTCNLFDEFSVKNAVATRAIPNNTVGCASYSMEKQPLV